MNSKELRLKLKMWDLMYRLGLRSNDTLWFTPKEVAIIERQGWIIFNHTPVAIGENQPWIKDI